MMLVIAIISYAMPTLRGRVANSYKAQSVEMWSFWVMSIGMGAMVLALTGAGIAAYQTWLQRFAKGVSCTADQPWWEHFVNWAGTQWPLMFEASGLCSEAGWKFLGLSIAEWSLIAFTSMTIAMLVALLGKATAGR